VQKTICTWLGSLSSRRIGELSAKVYQYISKFLVLHPKKHRLFCIAIYNIFVKPCPKWLVSPKSHHQIFPPSPCPGRYFAQGRCFCFHPGPGWLAARFIDGDSGRTFSSEMGPN
jgi:hypothetical protein